LVIWQCAYFKRSFQRWLGAGLLVSGLDLETISA
jgi:hypothetical protein